MKWLCPLLLSVFIDTSYLRNIEYEPISTALRINTSQNNMTVIESSRSHHGFKYDVKRSSFSKWGVWSKCEGGHKTRRRYCLRRHVCGDSIRVEVASCPILNETETSATDKNGESFEILQKRQLNVEEVQKRFRGFSPWSSWTNCSRKCTTMRRRNCIKRSICGHKIVRQSAYCYMEGTYCHLWIRKKMQRRHDPGYKLVESMPTPALAIHREDSRPAPLTSSAVMASCGKLGRYRGSAAARLRGRMREMIRIIGGRPAPPGKWPWQVVVLNRYKEAFCGGTLISLRWVVTAAHCIRKRLFVRLGEHDLFVRQRGEVEMRVTEAVVHPRYDPDTVVNDVAMLRLPAPARPDLGHGVACLPQANQVLPPHTSCVILGWGKKRATDVHGTRVLHEAQVSNPFSPPDSFIAWPFGVFRSHKLPDWQCPLNLCHFVSTEEFQVSTIQQGVCRRAYWQYAITDNMVCAGRGRRDSCAGDSGGPLLCRDRNMRYYLQGITSFGDGCGKRGKYGIYTRTSGYVEWIKTVMNNVYFD